MVSLSRFGKTGLSIACLAIAGLGGVFRPSPATGAEEIQVVLDGPLSLELSVDALEEFAETGETTGDLSLIVSFLPEALQDNLREQLQRTVPFDRATISNVTYSPLGRDVLTNLGKVIRIHPEVEGFYGLRAALINAAAAGADNWSVIDVLRQFPTERIHVRLRDLLELRRVLTVYFDYNEAVVEAIQQQALAEIASTSSISDSASLPDSGLSTLSQPGPYAVSSQSITVAAPTPGQPNTTIDYEFPVDVYYSEALEAPAPILIISHGFGDEQASFTFIAEHLASHGFVVMIPAHVGSDLSYRQGFLEGRFNTLLNPTEFINRPQEISLLIDDLERRASRSPWASRLDLDRIAVMGDSLGGSTALALAGARINQARLIQSCSQENVILNIALYLECQAQFLPPEDYRLRDERISAAVAMHPMGGYLYGPEGMAQVTVPLLMISGSNDIVAPVVTEQIYPFLWARSTSKYLALLQTGTHFTSKPGRVNAEGIFSALIGKHRLIGSRYAKALILAFLRTHLVESDTGTIKSGEHDEATLTAAAGRELSLGEPLQLYLIRTLAAEQIEAVYGRRVPVPIQPPPID
ncbi:MAG: alpha/beta hydrolase [Cyanobacteria bacterium P01_A01_bin.135]